uniref:Uncharacterized protein n=1 Tax=Macrostomum lignano TaxID=282301 RepID=A0A1I8JKK6_9PLAT
MNSKVNPAWQPASTPLQLPSPSSGDLASLLQALANQTAQTQAMLTALMTQSSQPQNQTSTAISMSQSNPEALLKALMAELQQTSQGLPASAPQVDNKRLKVATVSSMSSSSPGSSPCTSPNLDADLRSTRQLVSSFPYGDDSNSGASGGVGGVPGGNAGIIKSAVGSSTTGIIGDQGVLARDINGITGVREAGSEETTPASVRSAAATTTTTAAAAAAAAAAHRQTQFPATCSLLSGVSAVQGTAATSTCTVVTDAERRGLQESKAETAISDSRYGPYQLLVAAQPELNHRARYLTEGSRGAVKDRSQTGYPAV